MSNREIAVIGYSCRVPGASDIDEFWELIAAGRDVVTRAHANVGATAKDRVHAYGLLERPELFDEEHFGYSPREAAEIDPQQRLLLMCAVEALESAGVRPSTVKGDIGVWASTGLSGYLLETRSGARDGTEAMATLMGGDHHYASTRIAYKLGLTGPAVSVGSACSSSLLAVHSAAQAIRAGECDLALAGGMDIEHPQPMSYLRQDGGILSADGVCRPFDEEASGTVFGSGGGLVLLADLELAEQEGWPIQATLMGSASNNDGSVKASFTAPKSSRQADVIAQALAAADLEPEDLAYIECHGTGTDLGDRSELEALASVFGPKSGITLGSLKANLGHLRVAAGVAGLIKACEMLRHGTMPPLANLRRPTPTETASGFVLPTAPAPIPAAPAKAVGVSSFGFGGTNVHAIVGAAPPLRTAGGRERPEGPVVLQVSAATPDSCLATSMRLADRLRSNPGLDVGDIAGALQRGREPKAYRLAVVAEDTDQACAGLAGDTRHAVEGWAASRVTPLVLIPGQGADLGPVTTALWDWEPVFTETLRALWSGLEGSRPGIASLETARDHPARLPLGQRHAWHTAVVLAMIDQLRHRGMPEAVFAGYSLGEYAAAAAAGAIDTDAVLPLLVDRGTALANAPAGRMLAVQAGPEEASRILPGLTPAAILSDRRTVFAVSATEADTVAARLDGLAVAHRPIDVDLPYHSPLLSDAAAAFDEVARAAAPNGRDNWIPTLADEGDPGTYWERHLHRQVDLRTIARAAGELNGTGRCAVVDLSRDGFLGRLTETAGPVLTARPWQADNDPRAVHLRALAELWTAGLDIDLSTAAATARPVRLPARSWDLKTHLKTAAETGRPAEVKKGHRAVVREPSIDRWAYHPSWRMRLRNPQVERMEGQRWLVFAGNDRFSEDVLERLRELGVDCVCLRPGEGIVPGDEHSVKAAIERMDLSAKPIQRVLHLWCAGDLDEAEAIDDRLSTLESELGLGFYSLLFGFQAITREQGAVPLRLDIVSRGAHPVDGVTQAIPERALLSGPALVIPQDFPFTAARSIDIAGLDPERALEETVAELRAPDSDRTVAFAPGTRWVRCYERDTLPRVDRDRMPSRLRDRGVYLITGGLGGIGMTLAEYLVRTCRARLVLTGLDPVPPAGIDPDQVEEPALVERLRRIRKLEDLGGEVLAVQCDAADREQTAAMFAEIDRRFGGLDGVVHAAGVFETQRAFRSLEDTGRDDCERRLLPKVQGTLMLAEFLRGRRLDFVLMQSSLSSHLGGLGFYAYTAGNAYMDAFAERHRDDRIPWMTVNWDGWIFRERGEDAPAESVVSPSFASPDFGVVAEIAIRPSEGADIYGRLMDLAEPHQVLISTADFEARIDQWVRGSEERTDREAEPESEAAPRGGAVWTDPTSAKVAAAWTEVLGAADLEPESNFFALGGDSLLGVTLAYRLSLEFGTVVSAITLFEHPTIAEMAAVIDGAVAAEGADRD